MSVPLDRDRDKKIIDMMNMPKIPGPLKNVIKRHVRFSPTYKFVHPVEPSERPDLKPLQKHRKVVQLQEQEVRQLESRYKHSVVPMQERLRAGDACYAIQNDSGQVECFQWVTSGRSIYVPEVGSDVWVPEEVAYFYGAFTFPEVRGQGLMTNLKHEILGILASSRPPTHRCEAWVMKNNKANIRSLGKTGWKIKESFFFASIGSVHISVGRPWIRDGLL